jgi:hypothetical protein
MSHYAKVEYGVVTDVIVAGEDFFETFVDDTPGEWVQTSYNNNIRERFAMIGGTYDENKDIFLDIQPHKSWVLDADNTWKALIDRPNQTDLFNWNEDTLAWDEVVEPTE